MKNENNNKLDSFVFFRSYFDSIEAFVEATGDYEKGYNLYRCICNFALNGELTVIDTLSMSVFNVIKVFLERSRHRTIVGKENGSKGGGQPGNKNAKKDKEANGKRAKNEQKTSKKRGKTKQYEYEYEYEDENEDENEEENEEKSSSELKIKDKNNDLFVGYPSDFIETFKKYEEMRKTIKKPLTEYAKKLLLKKLNKLSGGNLDLQIEMLEQSISGCYLSVFLPNNSSGKNNLTAKDIMRIGGEME